MKRALFLLFVSILAASCGNQSVDDGGRGVEARYDFTGEAGVDGNGFIKCSQEFAPITSSFNGLFSGYSFSSSYLIGHIGYYIEKSDFSQALRDLTFTKEDPCKQIETTFSGSFANHSSLMLKILKTDAIRELAKIKQYKIKNFIPSYFTVSNDFLPDNVSKLPNHNFEVSVSCPTEMNVFCYPEGENCEAGQAVKAKFPDEPCGIKGVNQIFALYPSGQVIIDFEGTITKIRSIENGYDELETKFTYVAWR